MGKVRIVADSTCDLTKELLEKNRIIVNPLCIVMEDKSYLDGKETTPDEIYQWADANKTTPKTAAVTYENTEAILKEAKEAGEDVIFFGISEQMSTTCNVVRLVAEDLEYADHTFVVDSMNLSTGIGLQVLYACELRDLGLSAVEIVDTVESRRDKVRASFVVDTLTYLARGGRCNAMVALAGNALKLKPEIVVKDGAMDVAKKYRGSQKAVLHKYVTDLLPELEKADKTRVFITHSGMEEDIIAMVKESLEQMNYFEEILITRAGGVISSHCGPGTLGVLFYGE